MKRLFLTLVCCLMPAFAVADFEYSGLAPHLGTGADGTVVLSYIERLPDGPVVQMRVLNGPQKGFTNTLPFDRKLFVNWADFPSVEPLSDDLWVAHALVRRPAGGYAYDIHASVSHDRGETWSEPFLLHDDDTDTEHGFVTLYPADEGFAAAWLDGRMMSGGHGSGGAMTLRSGHFDKNGNAISTVVIDDRTCDCCQTDVAITADGPLAVYRDRSIGEIRDIYFARLIDDVWSNGEPVGRDGWNIAGCPVNGPTVEAAGDTVAVSWFSAANDVPVVRTAWSADGGNTFQRPVEVAQDTALGYVATDILSESLLLVAWVCRGGDGNTLCYRVVGFNGEFGPIRQLPTGPLFARMTVPQVVMIGNKVLFVWTERLDDKSKVFGHYVHIDRILDRSPSEQPFVVSTAPNR